MLRFITRFFAVIGFGVTLLIVLACVGGYYLEERPAEEPESAILSLAFDEPIAERSEPSTFDLAFHEEVTPLLDILHAIKLAKDDPRVKGIVAYFGSMQPSLTQSQEIRAALADFRTSGKFTYAYASSYGDFGMGNRDYYLASVFENIWLQPVGSVALSGLAIEVPFAKTALEKIGVSGDFMQREEYKSAMDNITRDGFAPEVRVETQAMIEDLAQQIAGGIAESRKWDAGRVKQMMAEGPYTDEEALKAGLVTHLGYADELAEELDKKAGKDTPRVAVGDYLSFSHEPAGEPKARIAFIQGSGVIVSKADGASGIPGEEHIMGADKIAEAFNAAAEAKDIDAILFRIDSPGGSPEASETIRRALIHAQKEGKPVVVSMGDVAASGGYWVAMNADRIVAEPATLTGSIGVVAGKFVLTGLMQKIGVNWETLKTSEGAGMWSMVGGFSPPQRARMNALLDQTYNAFKKNVSDARKIPMEKMPDIAKGRVWTGAQAVKLGLVDQLGGYEAAMDALRKKLKLGEKDPMTLEPFPPPESTVERAMKLLKNFGIESVMLGPSLMQWRKLGAMLGPLWRDMAGAKPGDLRMSATAERAVR